MAEITKVGTPSVCTVLPDAGERVGTFTALAAIAAGDACYVMAGGVRPSTGVANDVASAVHGWAGTAAAIGEVVTLWANVNFQYAASTTDLGGNKYYVSATVAGGLNSAATTGGLTPCAFGLPGGRIRVLQVIK